MSRKPCCYHESFATMRNKARGSGSANFSQNTFITHVRRYALNQKHTSEIHLSQSRHSTSTLPHTSPCISPESRSSKTSARTITFYPFSPPNQHMYATDHKHSSSPFWPSCRIHTLPLACSDSLRGRSTLRQGSMILSRKCSQVEQCTRRLWSNRNTCYRSNTG